MQRPSAPRTQGASPKPATSLQAQWLKLKALITAGDIWHKVEVVIGLLGLTSIVAGVLVVPYPMPEQLHTTAIVLSSLSTAFCVLHPFAWPLGHPRATAILSFLVGWTAFATNYVVHMSMPGASNDLRVALLDVLQVALYAGSRAAFALAIAVTIASLPPPREPGARP